MDEQYRLDGEALHRLREALPGSDSWFDLYPGDYGTWCVKPFPHEEEGEEYVAPTIAEAADKAREALS